MTTESTSATTAASPLGSASSEGLGLRAWLVERYESAMAIAARKSNTDRAGWLEDAAYFKAAVKVLDGRMDAVLAERERCAKLCDAKFSARQRDGLTREARTARALAAEIRGPNVAIKLRR